MKSAFREHFRKFNASVMVASSSSEVITTPSGSPLVNRLLLVAFDAQLASFVAL